MKKVFFLLSLIIFSASFIACKKETNILTPEPKDPCVTEKLSSAKAVVATGNILHYLNEEYVLTTTTGGVSVGVMVDGQKFSAGEAIHIDYLFVERINNFSGWNVKPFHELVLCEKGGIIFERHARKSSGGN